MSEQFIITRLDGAIVNLEKKGTAYMYEGTVLCEGTYKGIDGHEIHYVDSDERGIQEVFAEAVPTFSGTQLVHGHYDRTQRSVKGFNAVTWLGEDGCIKNKGYIFDPEIVKLIDGGDYPLGQSMEARVYVNSKMQAIRVVGERVAIGIGSPACKLAKQEKGKEVRLSMGDNKLISAVKAKLAELGVEAEKISDVTALLGDLTVIDSDDAKKVLMGAKEFADLKALAAQAQDQKGLITRLETVETLLKKNAVDEDKRNINMRVDAIKTFNAEFDVVAYLEGVEAHDMQIRLLDSYIKTAEEFIPMIPVAPLVAAVSMEKSEESALMKDMMGVSMEEFLGLEADE